MVIDKIHNTQATNFETSVEGLQLLKTNNVSDAVIRAMMTPRPSSGSINTETTNLNSETMPEEAGVYVVQQGKLSELQVEVYELKDAAGWLKTYGNGFGINKLHLSDGRISSPSSPLRLSGPQEFIIKAPDIADMSNYRLLRLEAKKNYRHFHQLTAGRMLSSVSNDTDKDDLPLTPQKIAIRT